MSILTDRSYHESRAREELRRAEQAIDPSAAAVHRALAALHKRKLIALVESAERMLPLPPTGGFAPGAAA
jgi:hypothetical protein